MTMIRNVRLLEIYNIGLSALFAMPVFVPYYRDVIGLTFRDFLIGEAVFAGVIVALEVPSGWLSDVWKRKHVLLLSCIFWIAGLALLLVAGNLATTVIAQGIIGVGVSLFSGTTSALLYDTLLAEGREQDYSRLEGRRQGLGFYTLAIASIAGGFMYEIHPALPLWCSVIAALPAIACCMAMIEPPRHKSAIQGHPLKDMMITLRYALHGHAEISFIIIFAALLFSGTKLIMWSQQPYYMAIDLPEYYYGILMAGGFVLGGVSSQLAHKLDGRVSNLRALSLALLAALAVCVLSSWHVGLHGVALLMIGGSCIFGMSMPRVSDAINRRVASDRRATILSTANLLRELFFIPLSLLVGAMSELGGVGHGLQGVAGWLVLAGIFIGAWAVLRARQKTPQM